MLSRRHRTGGVTAPPPLTFVGKDRTIIKVLDIGTELFFGLAPTCLASGVNNNHRLKSSSGASMYTIWERIVHFGRGVRVLLIAIGILNTLRIGSLSGGFISAFGGSLRVIA